MKRAVLVVDHGSRRAEANAALDELATLLRARLPERVVVAAHMDLAEPSIQVGVEQCVEQGAEEILVLPYFLAPGNHTREDVPRLVEAAVAKYPGVRARLAEPLGLHPGVIEVLLARIAEVD